MNRVKYQILLVLLMWDFLIMRMSFIISALHSYNMVIFSSSTNILLLKMKLNILEIEIVAGTSKAVDA